MTLSKLTRALPHQEDRFSLLLDLADTFSRSARRSWGYSPEQIELGRHLMPIVTKGAAGPFLPAALASWYATVGQLPELTSTQNRLRPPDELEMQYGVVVIYTENQSCAIWGIRTEDLEQDDPPVVVTEDWEYWGAHWRPEADTVSSFALTVGLTELCLHGGRFGCSGSISLELKRRRSARPFNQCLYSLCNGRLRWLNATLAFLSITEWWFCWTKDPYSPLAWTTTLTSIWMSSPLQGALIGRYIKGRSECGGSE